MTATATGSFFAFSRDLAFTDNHHLTHCLFFHLCVPPETQICSLCAASIDHIYTFIFLHQRRAKPTVVRIQEHLASDPSIGNELISTLFNSLLFSTHANHWAVTRPILSLLLANEAAFTFYQEQLVAAQPVENQTKLQQVR